MSIIYINPYRFGSLWTPAAITTALWLDAADASSVTTVSGRVSQWNDKSGNARNASQSTSAQRPGYTASALNGLSVLEFDPNSSSYQELSFNRLTGIGHVFFVAKKNNANDSSFVLSDAAAGSDIRGVNFGADAGSNFSVQQLSGSLSTATRNSWHIAEIKTDGANASLGINGTRTTNADADLMTSSSIGRYGNVSPGFTIQYSFRGQVAEIVMSLLALNDASRQRMEGYLAHKWGLAANLPNDHPYKSAAPTL
jgi:hypothetical protein